MQVDEPMDEVDGASFAKFQTRLVKTCKAIARTSQDINSQAGRGQPEDLAPLAKHLTQLVDDLAKQGQGAVAYADSDSVR